MTLFASWPCAQGGASNWAGSKACTQVGYFRTITNIFIDYFYALLPIYILRKVKMSTKLKVSVLLLLGLGALYVTPFPSLALISHETQLGRVYWQAYTHHSYSASSATIVKLVIIVRLSTAKGEEAQALHYDLLLWADIELGMATFAASAAALRPLLKHIPNIWSRSQTSNSRSRTTSEAVGPYRELGASNELHPVRKHDARITNGKDSEEDVFVV